MPDGPGDQTFRRVLSFSFPPTPRIEEVDGGLLVRDVPMLAAGVWTDSAQQTPLDYSASVLERHHANWLDTAGWSRHHGGVPRRITEKVAEARNLRFMAEVQAGDQTVANAVVADVFIHCLTGESRDTAAMVKAGLANYVSVEHGGSERWNVGRKLYELQDLFFTGFAIVNRGACAKCRLNEDGDGDTMAMKQSDSLEGRQEALKTALTAAIGAKWPDGSPASVWPIMTFDDKVVFRNPTDDLLYSVPYLLDGESFTFGTPVEVEQVYVEKKALEMMPALAVEQIRAMIDGTKEAKMDTAELEAKLGTLEQTVEEQKNALEAAQQENLALKEQLATAAAEKAKEMAAVEGRLKALETAPAPKAGAIEPAHELTTGPRLVHRNGETYREA